MDIDEEKKLATIEVIGTYSRDNSDNFRHDYKELFGGRDMSEYTLFIDCVHMDLLSADTVERLQGSIQLYKKSNFNKIVCKVVRSPMFEMHCARIGRGASLDMSKVEFVYD